MDCDTDVMNFGLFTFNELMETNSMELILRHGEEECKRIFLTIFSEEMNRIEKIRTSFVLGKNKNKK